jgi:hypothetical protein
MPFTSEFNTWGYSEEFWFHFDLKVSLLVRSILKGMNNNFHVKMWFGYQRAIEGQIEALRRQRASVAG